MVLKKSDLVAGQICGIVPDTSDPDLHCLERVVQACYGGRSYTFCLLLDTLSHSHDLCWVAPIRGMKSFDPEKWSHKRCATHVPIFTSEAVTPKRIKQCTIVKDIVELSDRCDRKFADIIARTLPLAFIKNFESSQHWYFIDLGNVMEIPISHFDASSTMAWSVTGMDISSIDFRGAVTEAVRKKCVVSEALECPEFSNVKARDNTMHKFFWLDSAAVGWNGNKLLTGVDVASTFCAVVHRSEQDSAYVYVVPATDTSIDQDQIQMNKDREDVALKIRVDCMEKASHQTDEQQVLPGLKQELDFERCARVPFFALKVIPRSARLREARITESSFHLVKSAFELYQSKLVAQTAAQLTPRPVPKMSSHRKKRVAAMYRHHRRHFGSDSEESWDDEESESEDDWTRISDDDIPPY